MLIEPIPDLNFKDVFIKPKRSEEISRKSIQLERTFTFKHSPRELTCVPIIASNMDATGTFVMAVSLSKHKMLTCLHKFYELDKLVEYFKDKVKSYYTFYSLGTSNQDYEKFASFCRTFDKKEHLPNICIDIANGYNKYFVEYISTIRRLTPESIIMAGNVCTSEMVQELLIKGADIISVGTGSGAACLTRNKTGVGIPQLSAVIRCADTAHGIPHGKVCSDGGCKEPGDICKALGAGADFIMLGYMIAGTDQCEGEWNYNTIHKYVVDEEASNKLDTLIDGVKFKQGSKKSLKFHGMSSREAQEEHYGSMEDYRASEGREIEVQYRGSVDEIVKDVMGGIRSCCTYIGAKRLKDIPKCTTFVIVK